MPIPVFSTYIDPDAQKLVAEVLKTTYLSEGRKVKEFEDRLSETLGLMNPVALNSGTSALCLALRLAGIKPGDEVICPAQTFIATALAVLETGAKPVFADIQYETGNLDPVSVQRKITPLTKAILAVHWGGYPCDLDELNSIAKSNNIALIEDAAHALGAEYKGKPIGSVSEYTCFSFQAIKHLTTGDGGALCCINPNTAKIARTKRWFGIDRDAAKSAPPAIGGRVWNIETAGFKYHMNDYAAALGLANLKGFAGRIDRRRKIADLYTQAFRNIKGLTLFHHSGDRKSAWWVFGMHVQKREEFARAMNSRGVLVSVVDRRIDQNKVFGGICHDLITQSAFDETQIHIPIHDNLTDDDIKHIIDSVTKGW